MHMDMENFVLDKKKNLRETYQIDSGHLLLLFVSRPSCLLAGVSTVTALTHDVSSVSTVTGLTPDLVPYILYLK